MAARHRARGSSRGQPPRWEVVWLPHVRRWYEHLDARDRGTVDKVVPRLEEHGPTLGRPTVERITGSRYHNLKELRSVSGNIRVLFAFDRTRRAVLLHGGDKTNNWKGFYTTAVPAAERHLEQYLRTQGKEPPWRTDAVNRGTKNQGRTR